MRIKFLVAIATMMLGLGSLYTTAKASQFNVFDEATVSAPVTATYEVKGSDSYTQFASYVPAPATNDEVNRVIAEHEAQIRQREVMCLARNIYFEARGESKVGQIAVGQVTINRVKAGTFEDSICGVVHQHNGTYKNRPIRCQFEWYCNNLKHTVNETVFAEIVLVAEDLYDHYYMSDSYPDLVSGALYFHAKSTDIGPRKWKRVVTRIDNHVFYNTVARL